MIITDPSKKPSERLSQVLHEYFISKGYVFKKSTHQFIKTTGNKKDSVFLSYNKTADLVSASLAWAVVFPELEKIYSIVEGAKEKSTVKAYTLWTNLLHFLPVRDNNIPSSFDMYSKNSLRYDDFSLNNAAENLITNYEKYVEPFLQHYNDLRTLEAELNKHPLCHHPYAGYAGRQITFGLVLANRFNKDKFASLLSDYRNYIPTAYMQEDVVFRNKMEKFIDDTITYLERVDIDKIIL